MDYSGSHRSIPLERFRFVNWKGVDIIDQFEAHVLGKKPNADGDVKASWDWISESTKFIIGHCG